MFNGQQNCTVIIPIMWMKMLRLRETFIAYGHTIVSGKAFRPLSSQASGF